jgi:uncharacterized alkaline shock family protein YloU
VLDQFDEIDAKEMDLPETVFIRDIENRVFQAITIKCLSEITGVSLLEGNILDDLLGREGMERVKGIYIEQDAKNHAVNIKVELNIAYGISIPEKAEEIQLRLVKNITELTGLHVASVHVVFKNLLSDPIAQIAPKEMNEYSEEF